LSSIDLFLKFKYKKKIKEMIMKVKKSEIFRANGVTFIPAQAMSAVFDSKKATREFDRDCCINHPTKGRMYPVPEGVAIKFVNE